MLTRTSWCDGPISKSLYLIRAFLSVASCQRLAAQPLATTQNKVGTKWTSNCPDPSLLPNGLPQMMLQCVSVNGRADWFPSNFDCQVDRCPPVPLIGHSRAMARNTDMSSEITIHCDKGYRFVDGTQVKAYNCSRNLRWNQHLQHCKRDVCPKLSAPANGTISTTVCTYGTTVRVECAEGFEMSDGMSSTNVTCQEGGYWSNNITSLSDCYETPCFPPSTRNAALLAGFPDQTQYRYGAVLVYQCSNNHHLDAYGHATSLTGCGQGGRWNVSDIYCDEGRCSPVPQMSNSVPSTLLALNGTTVLYECDSGYTLMSPADNHLVCNGTHWLGPDEMCTRVLCPSVHPLLSGWVDNTANTFESAVNFECDLGYHFVGNRSGVITCGSDSIWHPAQPVCSLIDCGKPPDHSDSIRTTFYTTGYNSWIVYRCIPKFWYAVDVFEQNITCQADGNWGVMYPVCNRVRCPALPTWDYLTTNNTSRHSNTMVSLSCEDGYRFGGDYINETISTCDDYGRWDPEVPRCRAISKTNYEIKPTDAEQAQRIGVGVILALASVIVVIVAMDLPAVLATSFLGRILGIKLYSKHSFGHKKPRFRDFNVARKV